MKALDDLNLNFVEGIAGTFTQDLLQHLIKKDAIHKAYLKRKREGAEARQRLEEAVRNTRLTGGLMFKVRHVTCDDDVLAIRKDMEDKKRAEKAVVIMKHEDNFNDKLDKYHTLFSESNKKSKSSGAALRIW